jgi:hypothetical protein
MQYKNVPTEVRGELTITCVQCGQGLTLPVREGGTACNDCGRIHRAAVTVSTTEAETPQFSGWWRDSAALKRLLPVLRERLSGPPEDASGAGECDDCGEVPGVVRYEPDGSNAWVCLDCGAIRTQREEDLAEANDRD